MFLYQVQARNVERVTEDVFKRNVNKSRVSKKRQVLNVTVTHFNYFSITGGLYTSSLQLKLITSKCSQQPSVCLMGTPLHF